MTRIHRALALLPVVAVLTACGSSATAPGGGGGTPTTTYYVGSVASPVATGSFKATVTTPASGEVLAPSTPAAGANAAGGVRPLQGGPSVTITITLLNGTILTLTGPVNGGTMMVSDNNMPPDNCTGTIANVLGATCTFFGQSGIQLVGVLATLDALGALTTYCGSEIPVDGSPSPGGSLILGVAGANSFMARVAPPNNALSGYLDDNVNVTGAGAGVVADTLIGPSGAVFTDFFGGSFTPSLASGTHAISGSLVGNWSAASPCVLLTEGLSSGGETPPYEANVVFTAQVNTTPAMQSVLVSPMGIGPITATLKTPAPWLTMTVSGSYIELSAAPQTAVTAVPTADTVKVYVWAQFAKNAPDSIFISYNVTSGPAPVLSGQNNTLTFNMTQGAAPPAAQVDQISATGGTVPLTQPPPITYTSPGPPQSWLTASVPTPVTPGAPVQLSVQPAAAASSLGPGQYLATLEVTSPTVGVAPVIVGVTLNVSSSTACTITNQLAPGKTYATLDPLNMGTYASYPLTAIGSCAGPGANWLTSAGSLPAGMMFEPDENVIDGTPTATGPYSFTLELGGAPMTLPFQGTVNPAQGCVLGPVTLPGGTHGQSYGSGIVPSTACMTAGVNSSPNYSWSISGNAGTGLGLAAGAAHLASNSLFGTPTAAGTDVITITFTNANVNPSVSATVTYTILIQ